MKATWTFDTPQHSSHPHAKTVLLLLFYRNHGILPACYGSLYVLHLEVASA